MAKKSKSRLTVPDELMFSGRHNPGWIGGTLTTPEASERARKLLAQRKKDRVLASGLGRVREAHVYDMS